MKQMGLKCIVAGALLLGFNLTSCSNNKASSEGEEANDTLIGMEELTSGVDGTDEKEAPIDTVAFETYVKTNLVSIIPDHEIENKEKLISFATPSLSSLLIEAFEMPVMYPGEIGDEDFLYYFLSGNGGGEPKSKAKVKSFAIDGNNGEVTVLLNGETHKLVILQDPKEGKWLLDDFDGKKSEVKEYVDKARKYFVSGEYLKNEYGDQEWKNEVKNYLKKYNK